jgi:hypothetical protein
MPRFIPISLFSEQAVGIDLYDEASLEKFKEKLNEHSTMQIVSVAGYEHSDLANFISSLNRSGTILFHSWIEQNGDLKELLTSGKASESFRDGGMVLSHRYADSFKSFITPYLTSILIGSAIENDNELLIYLSYTKLISGDDRPLVESQLFKTISQRLRDIKDRSADLEEEQELIDMIKPICSDELIASINELSKASYALKLDYVDTILNTIRTKSCTVRFANWILKQMEQVKLNKEHENKISEFRRDLREGKFELRNRGKSGTPIRWRSLVSIAIILVLAVATFYVIYFKPFNVVHEPEFEDTSSFTQFTKEERERIDSLIQTMSTQLMPDEIEVDPGVPIGGGTTLSLRKGFKNDLMEKIYNDMSKDAALKTAYGNDTCSGSIGHKRYSGVKPLSKRSGNVEAMIRNESDYDVILYLSDNKKGGSVYSAYLKKGSTTVFSITRGDVITAVAGNTYNSYSAPSAAGPGDILPSSQYKRHFCNTDINFEESINSSYQYTDVGRKRSKFMIMGRQGSYFKLMDVHNVLSTY